MGTFNSETIELAVLHALKLKGTLSELRSLMSYLKAIDHEDFGVGVPLFRLGFGGLDRRRRHSRFVRGEVDDLQVYVMFNLWRRNVRVRQSSVLELGYDDRVALPVLDIILLAIIVFIARGCSPFGSPRSKVRLPSSLSYPRSIVIEAPRVLVSSISSSSSCLCSLASERLERSYSWRRSPSLRSLIWLRSSLWPSTLIVLVSASSSLASSIVFRPSTSLPMVR